MKFKPAEKLYLLQLNWIKPGETDTNGGRFAKEIKKLKGGEEVSKQSHLKPLTPIMDELGVLRVGGRLNRAELPYDAAHPMILPKTHHITRLVVADVHHCCRHAGVNHVNLIPQYKYELFHIYFT